MCRYSSVSTSPRNFARELSEWVSATASSTSAPELIARATPTATHPRAMEACSVSTTSTRDASSPSSSLACTAAVWVALSFEDRWTETMESWSASNSR